MIRFAAITRIRASKRAYRIRIYGIQMPHHKKCHKHDSVTRLIEYANLTLRSTEMTQFSSVLFIFLSEILIFWLFYYSSMLEYDLMMGHDENLWITPIQNRSSTEPPLYRTFWVTTQYICWKSSNHPKNNWKWSKTSVGIVKLHFLVGSIPSEMHAICYFVLFVCLLLSVFVVVRYFSVENSMKPNRWRHNSTWQFIIMRKIVATFATVLSRSPFCLLFCLHL